MGDYLEALRAELADCESRKKTERVKAIKAEIARVSGTAAPKIENAAAAPVVETAATPKRKG